MICSGIETEYPVLAVLRRSPVLYVVKAEKPDGRIYDYRSFSEVNAVTAQQGYEYRRGHPAHLMRLHDAV